MQKKYTLLVILAAFSVLLLSALACNLPAAGVSTPNDSSKTIPTDSGLSNPGSQPTGTGELNITLTEGQINDIIQQSLQMEDTISDLQLRLLDGQIDVSGAVNQQGMSLPLRAGIIVTTDGQGGLDYKIASANVGPLPLPQAMRAQIEALLNQNLKSQVSALTNHIYIDSITISNGVMNITGHNP